MLDTFVASEETYDAFLRPAIYDSIKAVLAFYRLESAANIYYNGENEISKLVGSNRTDKPEDQRYTDGIFREKVFIVPDIQRSEFWHNRREKTERPVFYEKSKLPLVLYPAFENKRISVKVVSMHTSRNSAEQMRNRINRQRENQVVDFNFSPITHMVINPSIVEFFKVIHGLLLKNDPATPALSDWFYGQFMNPVHEISNPKGEHKRLAIPIKFNNVGIQFSDAFVAQVSKGQTYGRYEVEFNYSFYLNDFLGWELEYPLNVWQDEIPQQFIPRPQEQHRVPNNLQAAPEVMDARALTDNTGGYQTPFYLKLPEHDPWAWPYHAWMQPVIQARLALKDLPEQPLGNIFDLPYQWRPEIKAYILRRRAVAFSHYETPFLIQVFENDMLVDYQHLSMDENGLITLHRPPDRRKTYRVVITLDWAIRDYSEAFWDDLFHNEDDWALLPLIFNWYDWSQIPKPWSQNVWMIKRDIAKGWGQWSRPINIYEMNLGLLAYNSQTLRQY